MTDLCTLGLKNVPPLTCYNLEMHGPIAIIFARSVIEKVRNQTMLCIPTSPTQCFSITLRKRKPRRQRTGALCVQHSLTAAALSTSFLYLNFKRKKVKSAAATMPPKSPELNALIIRFRESRSSVNTSRESKRLKKSSSDWLNSGNALIQRVKKKQFSCLPFCQVGLMQKRKLFDVA